MPPPVVPQFPPPPPPPGEPRGIPWALVPFITFGFGTPFTFAYAAVRKRSATFGVTAAGYAGASAGALMLAGTDSVTLQFVAMLLMLTLWISGTVHAFVVRPSVFPKTEPRDRANEHAIQVAKHRRRLREDARALAAEDPALAVELRIGRPDLPRAYNDGGLIDVNHAPPQVLGLLPGLTDEMIGRIVRVRDEQGTFFSVEELGIDANLPPYVVQQISEYTIFLS